MKFRLPVLLFVTTVEMLQFYSAYEASSESVFAVCTANAIGWRPSGF